jgi:hypothetical protein
MLLKWDAAGECRQSATLAASEWALRNRSSYSAEIDRWSPQRPPVAAEPAAYDIQVVHSGPLSSARRRGSLRQHRDDRRNPMQSERVVGAAV